MIGVKWQGSNDNETWNDIYDNKGKLLKFEIFTEGGHLARKALEKFSILNMDENFEFVIDYTYIRLTHIIQ